MSDTRETPYGTVHIVPTPEIFSNIFEQIDRSCQNVAQALRVGLTGGSTSKAFYDWLSDQHPFPSEIEKWERILWSCSDERHVSLDDPESNFGNAQRGFLEPLGFSEANQRPWPVYCKPVEAAARFNRLWEEELPGHSVFDLCLLGMGADCHTASLFPGSPLLESSNDEPFAAVEVPSKGWRLTITPAGLQRCGRILVAVSGASKANALNLAFREKVDLKVIPVQILKDFADRVVWLIDEEAASCL